MRCSVKRRSGVWTLANPFAESDVYCRFLSTRDSMFLAVDRATCVFGGFSGVEDFASRPCKAT